MQQGLIHAGLPKMAVQSVPSPDRALVGAMLAASGQLDVIIPRGGKGLVGRVQEEARVPVFAHLEGICHLYISAQADMKKAADICVNAKMRRVGNCGAAETLLIDQTIRTTDMTAIVKKLLTVAKCVEQRQLPLATTELYQQQMQIGCEFLAPILAVKTVSGLDEAINHIRLNSSGHTESIITEDMGEAETFLNEIDSAIVMVNTSTQFADGGEFGMGAEIGIATGRLHARGPSAQPS